MTRSQKVVLLALCLAFLAPLSCRRMALRKQAPDLSYLPSDCLVVVNVEASRLRQAPLYQKTQPEQGQLRTFLVNLGIDPDRDLDEVLLAFRGGGREAGEWVAVLRGRFKPEVIEKGMEEPGARMSAEMYRHWKIHHLVRVPEIGDLSFAVVDPGAAVLGKTAAIRKVLDVRDKATSSLTKNETMTRLVSELDPRAQIWAVLDGKELVQMAEQRRRMLSGKVPEPALRDLSAVVDARLAVVVAEGLDISLKIGSSNEKGARNLSDAIRGILAFAKMGAAGRDAEAAAMIEAFSVTDSAREVQVAASIPGDLVKRFRDRLRETLSSPETPPADPEPQATPRTP